MAILVHMSTLTNGVFSPFLFSLSNKFSAFHQSGKKGSRIKSDTATPGISPSTIIFNKARVWGNTIPIKIAEDRKTPNAENVVHRRILPYENACSHR